MAELFFSVNLKDEITSAACYTIDDELLKKNIIDKSLIEEVLEQSGNPEEFEQSFTTRDIRVDILKRNEWKVEFFVSRDGPVHISPKNILVNPSKVSFH